VPAIPATFDEPIRRAVNSYLPDWDWLRLKAQLWQESRFNGQAVSPVGARGIAQFMPATWSIVRDRMGFPDHASPFDTSYAISACAWYMDTLRKQWTAKRSDLELWRLTLATYNTGMGNMLKAQKASDGANDFEGIMAYLPAVTGAAGALETRTYVARIEAYYAQLRASDNNRASASEPT